MPPLLSCSVCDMDHLERQCPYDMEMKYMSMADAVELLDVTRLDCIPVWQRAEFLDFFVRNHEAIAKSYIAAGGDSERVWRGPSHVTPNCTESTLESLTMKVKIIRFCKSKYPHLGRTKLRQFVHCESKRRAVQRQESFQLNKVKQLMALDSRFIAELKVMSKALAKMGTAASIAKVELMKKSFEVEQERVALDALIQEVQKERGNWVRAKEYWSKRVADVVTPK
ncbi:hypothetical protein BC829DRAFT_299611 [Chytridium lagenaria]|nr:hypothetical protein BC829DRAFT_299611 [Chytridium lagenaria]